MIYIKITKKIHTQLLTACLLVVVVFAEAQDRKYHFGIKYGWNYSVIDAIDNVGQPSGYISGIIDEMYGGLSVEKQIAPKSYLQSGLLVSYTDAITFLELPVFYKYRFYKNFSVLLGPKLDYIPDEQNNWFYYFRNRFGVSANLGVDYKISKKIAAEAYYSRGFIKQFDELSLGYYQSKRNVYRIGVTYTFF